MTGLVCLYVDDLRDPPARPGGVDANGDRWELARDFHTAMYMLCQFNYDVVSLDHDIASFYGNKEMTGRDILNWLIMRKLQGFRTPKIIKVHSANPVGCATMESDIKTHFPGE